PEYRNFGVDEQSLASLAAVTGGRELLDPAEAFDHSGLEFAGEDALSLWPWLLLLAVVLFPIDVAIRRLRVDPIDLSRRGWGSGRRTLADRRGLIAHWRDRLGARLRGALGVAN